MQEPIKYICMKKDFQDCVKTPYFLKRLSKQIFKKALGITPKAALIKKNNNNLFVAKYF